MSGARKPNTELQPIDIPPEKRGGWHVEDDFVAAIRGEQAVCLTTFDVGVRYMEFTEAVRRSNAQRRSIDLPLATWHAVYRCVLSISRRAQ